MMPCGIAGNGCTQLKREGCGNYKRALQQCFGQKRITLVSCFQEQSVSEIVLQ
jgi:hypothetical protein